MSHGETYSLFFVFSAHLCFFFLPLLMRRSVLLLILESFINDVETRLDVYIYDYLMKRDLQAAAKAFQAEAKVSSDPVGRLQTPSSLVCIGLILLIICYFFLQRFGDNVGQVMDANHAPMLKSAPNPGQPLGYAHFALTRCFFCRAYALTVCVLLAGANQAGNNLTLKGWPLTKKRGKEREKKREKLESDAALPIPSLVRFVAHGRFLLLTQGEETRKEKKRLLAWGEGTR
ncbi:hypothetical protein GW17_00035138 [Ensete ventricosum]|nr:hypothetical protein GW17_00035138 [Ensete ventricosum]